MKQDGRWYCDGCGRQLDCMKAWKLKNDRIGCDGCYYAERAQEAERQNAFQIGFTGTAAGMTDGQWDAVQWLLRGFWRSATEKSERLIAQHGGGPADEDFDNLCWALEIPRECVADTRKRVDAVDVMIACPSSREPVDVGAGSEPWVAIRYAREQNKELHICYPDGVVDYTRVTP